MAATGRVSKKFMITVSSIGVDKCRGQGFRFLDHWDLFWGSWDLYKRDGLHLNYKGTNILAEKFARTVGERLNEIFRGMGTRVPEQIVESG